MTPAPYTESSTGPQQVVEGDFSRRKIKIATAILVGQTFATSILPYSAMTFVMIPMTREFGWTRTQFSFATTFLFIFGAASLWPIGRIADKVGVRPVIVVGTTIVGLVTIAMSRQTASLALLFALYTLLGMFGSTGVAYTKVAAALFTQNRGKALAILGAESTIAAAIIPILTNFLMLNYGWRTMYVVFGALILAIVPILYFTIEEPGQIGINLRPHWVYKSAPSTAASSPAPGAAPVAPELQAPPLSRPPRLEGMTLSEALQDWVFWLITAAVMFGMLIATGMIAHMVPALIGKGFSQTFAAEMTSLFLLAGIGGSLAGGYAVDRFQTAKVGAPFSLLAAVGAFLLMIVTSSYGGKCRSGCRHGARRLHILRLPSHGDVLPDALLRTRLVHRDHFIPIHDHEPYHGVLRAARRSHLRPHAFLPLRVHADGHLPAPRGLRLARAAEIPVLRQYRGDDGAGSRAPSRRTTAAARRGRSQWRCRRGGVVAACAPARLRVFSWSGYRHL